ncbi:MAG TPA: hypothetical protein VGN12_12815 [Pirellulales bacterium]|jgi:hypothetical protein
MNNTHVIHSAASSPLPASVHLYRLQFAGGPHDGGEAQSAVVPEKCLQLPSGGAGCGTRSGNTVMPRLAQYRLQSVCLHTTGGEPVVWCRYEYFGTCLDDRSGSHWWHRCLEAFWQWLEPRPRTPTLAFPNRRPSHV